MVKRYSSDVLIVGAGAAGLSAARHLPSGSVRILESRGRIGGRIYTLHDATWPAPIELGAEFIHGRPPATWDLLRSLPAAAPYDVTDTHWHLRRGRLSRKDFWADIEPILSKLAGFKAGPDLSFADFLKTHARLATPAARSMVTAFIEGFNATDRNLVSARFLARAQSAGDEIDEMKAYRLYAGYDRLPAHLLASLDPARATLHLSTTVHAVRWSKGSVHVTATSAAGESEEFRARAAIVTVPVGVLQSGSIAFDPPLPQQKRRAILQMRMGPVTKIVARFREPFWERHDELRDLCFLHADAAPFPTCWTMLPLRTPVITGWAGGPASDRLASRSPRAVLDAFLSTLSAGLRTPKATLARLLQSWHLADWQRDPLARGAYSYATVGGSQAPSILAKPLNRTLFFAGEHTHSHETGTVAAALETGQRAAKKVTRTVSH